MVNYELKIMWRVHIKEKYIISRWNFLCMQFEVYSAHVFNNSFGRVWGVFKGYAFFFSLHFAVVKMNLQYHTFQEAYKYLGMNGNTYSWKSGMYESLVIISLEILMP